ncbi:MAG: peptide ABC transporter substrate-binding protein [Burkholderiales bacterium]|nr:peptide ABC transporter substrate-binding protein [Burkholderiales bacterium]
MKHPANLIRIDVGTEVPTLDPLLAEENSSTRVCYDLFAGLVDFDQKNQVIPGMASSWDISPDAKVYTFHLRNNLKFSDGSPITASDFVYSWQRLVDPKTASPYSFLLNSIVNAKQIAAGTLPPSALGVTAVNNQTLVVKLTNPTPSFLNELTLTNTFVVPEKIIKKYGKSWTNPGNMVTSGAYVMKEHVVNGYILATKNPYYYDANSVHIDNVKYLPYEANNISVNSYRSGGLDVTFSSIPSNQYAELKQKYGNQVHNIAWEGIYNLDFNMAEKKFANSLDLRKALSMAIDREVLTQNVLKEGEMPLYSLITSSVTNGAFANVKYDWANWSQAQKDAMAKQLFAQAGYNVNNPLQINLSYNTDEGNKRIVTSVAAMWKAAFGQAIKISLKSEEWKVFLAARHKGDFDIARDGWIADFNDPLTYMPLYYCGNDQNNAHYCNMQFNQLVDQAVMQKSNAAEIKLYQQAFTLALNDYPTIPLFQYTYQQMIKPYVKGYYPEGNNLNHVQTKWMSLD